jgi:drug/metabolite transporter (DMT)-like permease
VALLAVGVTAQAGQVYLTRGLQLEPAGRATAVGYLQIVFAAIWGAAFFSEYPDAWAVTGALLILVSTLTLARSRERPRRDAVGTSAADAT